MPTDPWANIDKSEEIWSAIDTEHTRTSIPSVAERARTRFSDPNAHLVKSSPEIAKMSPPTATQFQGPFGDYGYDTDLKKVQGFGSAFAQNLNPFAWIAPPMGELLAPTNPATLSGQVGPNQPPTMLNLPDRLLSSVLPDFPGIAKESYARGERGESTKDMYAGPAAMAAIPLAFKASRGIIPADIAAERARGHIRSALGTKSESFKHGSTPDKAVLQGLEAPFELVTRSEGRLLKKIQNSKNLELDALDKDLDVPGHKNNYTDPMESINSVVDDAITRAEPTEILKIRQFNNLILSRIRTVSNGTMKLNPLEINKLRRWVDGFISKYKEDTTGTLRDLAQNTRGALREHLDTVAPEVTIRNQRIQSLIDGEEALLNKITTPPLRSYTLWGSVRDTALPYIPTTLANTSAAKLLKMLSGDEFKKPNLPSPIGDVEVAAPSAPTTPPPPQRLLPPPSGVTVTPKGTAIPNSALTSGMAGGIPEVPGRVGSTASFSGAPTNVDPYNAAINAGQEYLGELKSGSRASGIQPPPDLTSAPIKMATKIPEKPTHVTEGMRVSGEDAQGNVVSGILEKLSPSPEPDGNIIWKGTILNTVNGRAVNVPADTIFDSLTGPPTVYETVTLKKNKTGVPAKPATTEKPWKTHEYKPKKED